MKTLIERKHPHLALRAIGRLPRGPRRRLLHWATMGTWPDLRNPTSYAEVGSASILKENGLLAFISGDKDAAKIYVRGLTNELKVPHTRWIGTDPTSLPDSALEGRWVAKLNAGSGAAVAGDGVADRSGVESFIRLWGQDTAAQIFCSNYYDHAREGVIIEDYLEVLDRRPTELRFFCFGGHVELVQEYQFAPDGKQTDGYRDREGRGTEITRRINRRTIPVTADLSSVPAHFDRARDLAELLSQPFAHVRVDLFVVGDDLWFGELTPYPAAGLVAYQPESFDTHLASQWLEALQRTGTSF